MAKNKVSEWSSTASANTDVGNIDINEGCAPSSINNAIREVMAQVKDMQLGVDGDPLVVGGNLSVTGTSTLNGATTVSGVLTASGGLTGNVTGDLTGNQSGGAISATTGTFSGVATFNGNVASSFAINARSSSDGGAYVLKKATASTLTNDVVVDTSGQSFRFFENGGASRGASLDLTTCAGAAASVIVTSTNIATYLPSNITIGTAQNSTSGTFIDFTGIPSTVKRITVMLNGISTNGTSDIQCRVGSSAGIVATGYVGGTQQAQSTTTGASITTGVQCASSVTATGVVTGHLIFSLFGSNLWVATYTGYDTTNARSYFSTSSISLPSALDRIRITTVGAVNTFDAGSINIMYE